MRFPAKFDEKSLLDGLNNIWIDSYKLRAFIPRFDRNDTTTKKKVSYTFDASSGRCNSQNPLRR